MVRYNYILKVIEDYVVKCPTILEIREKLAQLTFSEKEALLLEKGLLNEGESAEYHYLKGSLEITPQIIEEQERNLELHKNPQIKEYIREGLEYTKSVFEKEKEKLFQYEKRLLNGYEPRQPQVIEYDESKYVVDDEELHYSSDKGIVEKRQIESQEKITFSDSEIEGLQSYYGNECVVNSKLWDGEEWNGLSDEERVALKPKISKTSRNISKAINKTEGLLQDTTVWHSGKFDVTKIVGDKVHFKGFTSCSFREEVAEGFNKGGEVTDSLIYNYKILLPKGTKGICANDTHQGELTNYHQEHEYLLDKGFKGDIVDIDYEKQVVTIMPSE